MGRRFLHLRVWGRPKTRTPFPADLNALHLAEKATEVTEHAEVNGRWSSVLQAHSIFEKKMF